MHFSVFLVVSQFLEEGTIKTYLLACQERVGKVRSASGASEEPVKEICLVRIVVERNYLWCFATVVIFMRSEGAKR